jgi:hypothetical protein
MDSKNTGGLERGLIMKTVVMTMNVAGLTHQEFRAILDEMGVEASPQPGIYQDLSHPTETVIHR